MKLSNIVLSTAAVSLAGALGLAYAQTTYTDPQTGAPATTTEDATTSPGASGTMNQEAGAPMGREDTTTTTTTETTTRSDSVDQERMPRADRN